MPELSRTDGAAADMPLFWRADPSGLWTWSSTEWAAFTGLSSAQSLGWGWLAAVHPDDRQQAAAPWGAPHTDHAALRVRRSGQGGYRPMRPAASPVQGGDGSVLEWVGALQACRSAPTGDGADAAALSGVAATAAAGRREAGALQHHMRNALAVIRSVARRTARTSPTVEHHATHFEGRLDALARVQDAMIRNHEGVVDLESLISEELVAHRVAETSVSVEGPPLRIRSRPAESLALAIHELVINSVKFGAFGTPEGTVAVRWTIDEREAAPSVHFLWRETGITVAGPAPRRRGFGTELVEQSLPYELDAKARLEFRPGEVCCTIELPLTDKLVYLETP